MPDDPKTVSLKRLAATSGWYGSIEFVEGDVVDGFPAGVAAQLVATGEWEIAAGSSLPVQTSAPVPAPVLAPAPAPAVEHDDPDLILSDIDHPL